MRFGHASLAAAGMLLAANLASAQTPGLTITWAEDDANPRTWDRASPSPATRLS